MRTQKLNHSVYQHQYHIVWGTKYRRKYLKKYVETEFRELLFSLVKKYPTLYIHTVKTDHDHVHLQIEIPPDISVSRMVQRIKAYTSFKMKRKFPFIEKIYLNSGIWSVGYFSSTVGLNEEAIKKYISNQGRQDFSKQYRLKFS